MAHDDLISAAIALEFMACESVEGDRLPIPACSEDRSSAPLYRLANRLRRLAGEEDA